MDLCTLVLPNFSPNWHGENEFDSPLCSVKTAGQDKLIYDLNLSGIRNIYGGVIRDLQIDAKISNFDIFESALSI